MSTGCYTSSVTSHEEERGTERKIQEEVKYMMMGQNFIYPIYKRQNGCRICGTKREGINRSERETERLKKKGKE